MIRGMPQLIRYSSGNAREAKALIRRHMVRHITAPPNLHLLDASSPWIPLRLNRQMSSSNLQYEPADLPLPPPSVAVLLLASESDSRLKARSFAFFPARFFLFILCKINE